MRLPPVLGHGSRLPPNRLPWLVHRVSDGLALFRNLDVPMLTRNVCLGAEGFEAPQRDAEGCQCDKVRCGCIEQR